MQYLLFNSIQLQAVLFFLGQVLASPVGEHLLIISIKHRSVVCVQVSAVIAVNLDQVLS